MIAWKGLHELMPGCGIFQEAMQSREAATLAAVEALQEASAAESVLRSLRQVLKTVMVSLSIPQLTAANTCSHPIFKYLQHVS